MSTALTVYGYQGTAINLVTAAPVTASGGSPSLSGVLSTIGTATGWGEVFGTGSTPPGSGFNTLWPGAQAIGDNSGRGWLFDGSVLDNQDMLGGLWTHSWQLSVSSGSIVADIASRVSIWVASSDATVPVGTIILPAQTINTTPTTFTLTGLIDQFRMLVGYKLYFDLFLNVITNGVGSSSLTVAVQLPTTAVGSANSAAWVTPGFQPTTQAEAVQGVSYGNFLMSDMRGYYVMSRQFDFPTWSQTNQKVGRRVGVKKSGETINQREIPVKVKIVGKSRGDLLQKIDALYQALMLRQQKLIINSWSGRFWTADCIDCKIPVGPGNIISAEANMKFVAQMPFAIDPVPGQYIDGPALYTLQTGSVYQRVGIYFQGNGNVWSDPTLTITNNTPVTTSTLTTGVTSGVPVSSIAVSALGKALGIGDAITLVNGANSQTIVATVAAAAGATSISFSPSVTPNFSYPASTTNVIIDTAITQVTVNQVTDGRSFTCNAMSNMWNGHSLNVVCDAAAANGEQVYQVIGSPLPFTGNFPTLEPSPTNWSILVTAASPPTLTVQWIWNPRWAV